MRSKQPKVECCHSLDIISAIFLTPEHVAHRSTGEFLLNKFNVRWLRPFLAWYVLWLRRLVKGCLVVGRFILGRFVRFFPWFFSNLLSGKDPWSGIWLLLKFQTISRRYLIANCKNYLLLTPAYFTRAPGSYQKRIPCCNRRLCVVLKWRSRNFTLFFTRRVSTIICERRLDAHPW